MASPVMPLRSGMRGRWRKGMALAMATRARCRAAWLVVCLLVASSSYAARARAEEDPESLAAARETEASARRAFQRKNYPEAAEGFAAAFKLAPRANTKFNEAESWRKSGRSEPAADAFEAALAFGGLTASLEDRAREALAGLETKLGRLVVREPVGAVVDVAHAQRRLVPARIHLEPGRHDLTVDFPNGERARRSVTVLAGEVLTLTLEVPTPASPAPSPSSPNDASPDATLLVLGWTSTGLGAGALVAMGALGGLTLSTVSRYDDTGNTDPDLFDEATRYKTATNALLGIGGGLAATGVALLLFAYLGGSEGGDGSPPAGWLEPTVDGVRVRF